MKKKLFQEHYAKNPLVLHRIERREIALQPWGSPGPNLRNKYCVNTDELHNYLRNKGNIAGVFASTGYFLDPNEKDTNKRGYLGHDLVFDIDFQLEGSRAEWMEDICENTYQVVRILVDTFGFRKSQMTLEFSGNKGFHLFVDGHIGMSIESRRQIVDYITSENISRKNLRPSRGGWGKKLKSFIQSIGHGCGNDAEANEDLLTTLRFPKTQAKKIGNRLTQPDIRSGVKDGCLESVGDAKSQKALIDVFVKASKEEFSTVDRPVTYDKNRIFRVFNSIHPKSGLVCTPVDIEDLEYPERIFGTLKEAGGLDEVEITLSRPCVENFEQLQKWLPGTYKVPRWLALHLSVQN